MPERRHPNCDDPVLWAGMMTDAFSRMISAGLIGDASVREAIRQEIYAAAVRVEKFARMSEETL